MKKMPANVFASDRDDGGLSLIPRQESLLLHPCMSKLFADLIQEQACPSEFSKRTGIVPLNPSTFAQQLDTILPSRWKGRVIVNSDTAHVPGPPCGSWLPCNLSILRRIRMRHELFDADLKLGCPVIAPGFECFVRFYDENRMPWLMLSGLEYCSTGKCRCALTT